MTKGSMSMINDYYCCSFPNDVSRNELDFSPVTPENKQEIRRAVRPLNICLVSAICALTVPALIVMFSDVGPVEKMVVFGVWSVCIAICVTALIKRIPKNSGVLHGEVRNKFTTGNAIINNPHVGAWIPVTGQFCCDIRYRQSSAGEHSELRPGDKVVIYKVNNNMIFAMKDEQRLSA